MLFPENFKIMKKAWREGLLTWDGPTYKIPSPLDGIPDWPPAQTITSKYGAPGEIGEDGTTVRGVSVVPRPLQQPHPPLFQAFGASPPTIEWCGCNDVVPTILFGAVERIRELLAIYQAAHASAGREVAIGERLLKSGVMLGGTVDDCKRQLEAFLEAVPVDFLVWLFHWGIMPRDEGLRQLELFATKIMPKFGVEVPMTA